MTLGVCIGLTGKLRTFVITEIAYEIVMFIATSEVSSLQRQLEYMNEYLS